LKIVPPSRNAAAGTESGVIGVTHHVARADHLVEILAGKSHCDRRRKVVRAELEVVSTRQDDLDSREVPLKAFSP
jgi:hypothetical protein